MLTVLIFKTVNYFPYGFTVFKTVYKIKLQLKYIKFLVTLHICNLYNNGIKMLYYINLCDWYYYILIWYVECKINTSDSIDYIQRSAGFKHLSSLTTLIHTLIFNDGFATQKSPAIHNIIDCIMSDSEFNLANNKTLQLDKVRT